jgi:hypothetical protein
MKTQGLDAAAIAKALSVNRKGLSVLEGAALDPDTDFVVKGLLSALRQYLIYFGDQSARFLYRVLRCGNDCLKRPLCLLVPPLLNGVTFCDFDFAFHCRFQGHDGPASGTEVFSLTNLRTSTLCTQVGCQ